MKTVMKPFSSTLLLNILLHSKPTKMEVKSLPPVDSGDVIGWVAFSNESAEGSEHCSVDYMGKGEEYPI
jgi:hypothetical protein